MDDKEFYERVLMSVTNMDLDVELRNEARARLKEIVSDPKKSKCCHAPIVEIRTQYIKFCFKCRRDLNDG